MIVQPKTAVPAEYQWSFLMSENPGEETASSFQQNGLVSIPEGAGGILTAVEAPSSEAELSYLNKFQEESHHFHYTAMILSVIIAGFGIFLAFVIYQFKLVSADRLETKFKFLHTFSYRKWYFDELYKATAIAGTLMVSKAFSWFDNYIVDGLVNLSSYLTRGFSYLTGLFDNYVIDGAVNFAASFTGYCGSKLRKIQTGHIQTYIVFALLGILIMFYVFINF
jgi:NADH-quinone oxidoreductase subunit L